MPDDGRRQALARHQGPQCLDEVVDAFAPPVSTDYLSSGTLNEQAGNRLQDVELLHQFHKVEQLPSEQKQIVKELLDAFIPKNDIQTRFAAA